MVRQNPGCSEILVRAEIEPRKKKKRCLLREIKDLKGERIHLRFWELAINLVVRFLFFSFFSFCIAFFSHFSVSLLLADHNPASHYS